jgi:undecaprenyl-diphosphatase
MIDLLRNIDHSVFHFINQTAAWEWLDGFMIMLSAKWVMTPIYVLLAAIFIYKFKWQSWTVLLLAIIVVSITDALCSKVLKPSVKRLRPNHTPDLVVRMPNKDDGHSKYGFVSSHAGNFFALFVYTALMLRLKRKKFLLLLIIPALIAYSRVYLGVHYPADVLGGAILGSSIAFLAFWFYGRCLIWMKRT